jgi:hypothetical protein
VKLDSYTKCEECDDGRWYDASHGCTRRCGDCNGTGRAQLLEGKVQKDSVKAARKAGWWAQKFVAQGRRSAPDYIFARAGRVFFTEFKRTGEDATELQKDYHEKMREAGLTVYVCDDPQDFCDRILFAEA